MAFPDSKEEEEEEKESKSQRESLPSSIAPADVYHVTVMPCFDKKLVSRKGAVFLWSIATFRARRLRLSKCSEGGDLVKHRKRMVDREEEAYK